MQKATVPGTEYSTGAQYSSGRFSDSEEIFKAIRLYSPVLASGLLYCMYEIIFELLFQIIHSELGCPRSIVYVGMCTSDPCSDLDQSLTTACSCGAAMFYWPCFGSFCTAICHTLADFVSLFVTFCPHPPSATNEMGAVARFNKRTKTI